jgi:hypothetical protein
MKNDLRREVLAARSDESLIYFVVNPNEGEDNGILVTGEKRIPCSFWSVVNATPDLSLIKSTLFHKRLWAKNASQDKNWARRFVIGDLPFKEDELQSIDMISGDQPEPLTPVTKSQRLESLRTKVGLIESNNPVLRAGQAAASIAIPGNMSAVRRPGRSAVSRALTPGFGGGDGSSIGGRLIRRAAGAARDGESNQLRCPPGFEHGGRFAKADLSNCGMRLFDLPGFGLVRISRPDGANGPRGRSADSPLEAEAVSPVEAQNALDISRTALVTEVGQLDAPAREEGIRSAIDVAGRVTEPDFARLVRRDGTLLDNVVPVAQLANVRTSDDMEDAFLVAPLLDGATVGVDMFQAMSGGLDGIVMVLPGGDGFIRIQRSSKQDVRAIRGLRRRWGTLVRDQDPQVPGSALDTLIEESQGKLKLSVQYPGVKDPMAMITIERGGATRTVRRWVYQIFLSSEAPARPSGVKPWRVADAKK